MPIFDRNSGIVGMISEHYSTALTNSDSERLSGRRLYTVGDWINHDGGDMPVAADYWIQAMHPGGKEPGPPILADNLNWKDRRASNGVSPHHGNIVRYRLVQWPARHDHAFVNEEGRDVSVWAEYEPNRSIFCDGVTLGIRGPNSVHECHVTLNEARAIHTALADLLKSAPQAGGEDHG